MNTRRASVVLASAAVLAACGSPVVTSGEHTQMRLVSSDQQRARPAAGAPVDAAASGLRQFGYELIRDNPTLGKDGNLVISPASIGAAFAMARAGARGETAEQIDAVLHFPVTGLGDAYNALTRAWTAAPSGKDDPEVSIANAVFAQDGFDLLPAYLDALAHDFGTGVRTVDFRSGQAAQQIDAWVQRETHGRIDKLFDELDPATVLVLADATYLRATWEHRFLADLTTPAPFTRADGTVVRPQTMRTEQPMHVSYVSTNEFTAVRLPYVGGELAMWVLLPRAADGDPVPLLDPGTLADAMAQAQPQRVRLSLPKWDFQSDLSLTDVLQSMGMTVPFGGSADFSGISPRMPPIDEVMHRADITVDEKGTEAAAVTGIAFAESLPISDAVMDVDHPFAFVVVHEPTDAPLFEGVVGDPTATQ